MNVHWRRGIRPSFLAPFPRMSVRSCDRVEVVYGLFISEVRLSLITCCSQMSIRMIRSCGQPRRDVFCPAWRTLFPEAGMYQSLSSVQCRSGPMRCFVLRSDISQSLGSPNPKTTIPSLSRVIIVRLCPISGAVAVRSASSVTGSALRQWVYTL